jgi:hypothetical protein
LLVGMKNTGRHARNVPRLVMADHQDGVPQVARWQFDIDGVVSLRAGGQDRSSEQVYVGAIGDPKANRVARWLPQLEQPASVQTTIAPVPKEGETSAEGVIRRAQPYIMGTIRVRSGAAIKFVTVQEGN